MARKPDHIDAASLMAGASDSTRTQGGSAPAPPSRALTDRALRHMVTPTSKPLFALLAALRRAGRPYAQSNPAESATMLSRGYDEALDRSPGRPGREEGGSATASHPRGDPRERRSSTKASKPRAKEERSSPLQPPNGCARRLLRTIWTIWRTARTDRNDASSARSPGCCDARTQGAE